MTPAHLVLQDGSTFRGYSFGSNTATSGEVVFNTGMVGYPETLTDPSYEGQILTLTYPLIGNYGVPALTRDQWGIPREFESDKIHARALIVSEHCLLPSHWNSSRTLDQWLKDEGIPGIYGIDTRALTQKLREHGVMLGKIMIGNAVGAGFTPARQRADARPAPTNQIPDPNKENLVAAVSTKKKKTYAHGPKRVILIDCGTKYNIVRSLLNRSLTVIRVPWDYNFLQGKYDGIVVSNGPGDPTMASAAIQHLKKALSANKPILGICLGLQLMALAAGAQTYKLKFGHRSQNQPCRIEGTERCYITSQNHGYAVDRKTLHNGWNIWMTNANDGTVEGIKHATKPFLAVQFHPEATPGPEDTGWIFDEFVKLL